MTVSIDVDTAAFASLDRAVRQAVGDGARRAGEKAAELVKLNFDEEGNRTGDGWAPTTPVALAHRQNPPAPGAAWKILSDTGALRASVAAEVVNDAPALVEIEVRHHTHYGDDLDRGGVTTIDGVQHTLPPRPFLDLLDPEDVDLLEAGIDAALEGLL